MLGLSYQKVRRERQLRASSSLRSRELVFESMKLEGGRCRFGYRIGDERFVRTLSLTGVGEEAIREADPRILHRLLLHVGVALVPRFCRLSDLERARIEVEGLSPAGASFFAHILRGGLGELRYRNGLDVHREIELLGADSDDGEAPDPGPLGDGALVFNGGGKDTAVAGETLKALGVPITWLCCGRNRAMGPLAEAAGVSEVLVLEEGANRRRMQKLRRYRGHVPFNHLLAFLGLLAAYLTRTRYVVAANERSASFGNLEHEGFEVNHQYTKSFDFEWRFQRYVRQHLLQEISYFSLLRPLYEVQIAKIFTGYPQYFPGFMSCNHGVRSGRWCASCPKCGFLFVVLSAFLDPGKVREIFGGDPLRSERLRRWVRVLATAPERPFDCVGTLAETRLALALAAERGLDEGIAREGWGLPSTQELGELVATHLVPVEREHALPEPLAGPALDFFRVRLALGREEGAREGQ